MKGILAAHQIKKPGFLRVLENFGKYPTTIRTEPFPGKWMIAVQ